MQDTVGVLIMNSFEPWYVKYLLPFIGSLIVGIISFILTQWIFRKRDKTRSRNKYVNFLMVIRFEIKRNIDLLCALHAYIYVDANPTFSLSNFVSGEIFSKLTSVCLNQKLLDEIFYRYFDYKHIQNRIDRIIRFSEELKVIKSMNSINHNQEHAIEASLRNERGGAMQLIEGNIRVGFTTFNQITDEINLRDTKKNLKVLPSEYLRKKYDEFQEAPNIKAIADRKRNNAPNFDLNNRPKFYIFPDSETPNGH